MNASPAPPNPCPNCGARAPGAYCPECGQSRDVAPRTLKAWLRDFLEETLAVDGRLWRTLKALLLRPGHLAREWEAGRRARWTHPLRLYLLASFVFLASMALLPEGAPDGPSSETLSRRALTELQSERLGDALRANYPYLMFVLVPLFALWLKALYRKAGVLYVGHLVHALHVHAAFFLLLAVTLPFEELPGPWDYVAQTPFLVYALLYPVPSAMKAYGVRWLGATWRTAVLVPVHGISVMMGVVVLAVATGTLDVDSQVRDIHEDYWQVRDALAAGDSAAAREMLPVVISGYLRLEYVSVSPHVLTHLADALLLSGDPDQARKEAGRALVADPTYLPALGVAARAATAAGDSAAASSSWRRFLTAYPVPDSLESLYGDHTSDLIRDRAAARRWLAGSDGAVDEPGRR